MSDTVVTDEKAAKRHWAQRVIGWKRDTKASEGDAPINQEVFALAHQFGELLRDPVYAELPGPERSALRNPVEDAIAGQNVAEIKAAIATFKTDLPNAVKALAAAVKDRIATDTKKSDKLADRGSPGAKGVADLLKQAQALADAGRVGPATDQLDKVEAAIVADVEAHLGLAQGRIASLSDWKAPEAGGLETRLKAIRSKNTLPNFDSTLSDYDGLMRDIVAAATVRGETAKSRGLTELRKGIVAGLGAVPDDAPNAAPPVKANLQARFATWDRDFTAIQKETDAAKRDTTLGTLDTDGTALYADILAAKGGDTKAEKEAVYKKALEARYGFTIDTKGRAFTNFDKMYDVLRMVPVTDVKQSKLKKLEYGEPGKSGAAYGGATIEMGDYGDGETDWGYQNPDGSPAPANGFKISALHELGHSIDDRNGIMSSHGTKGGCGGWQPESVNSVAQVILALFRAGPGKNLAIPEATMKSLIAGALVNGTPAKPATISDTDWGPMKAQLDTCAGLRAAASPRPWNSPTPIGGRAYHQAYTENNEWWSYDPGARGGTTVRNYQWRSPAEWFAELYAFTYFKKQKPPSGIDASVAVFMYKA